MDDDTRQASVEVGLETGGLSRRTMLTAGALGAAAAAGAVGAGAASAQPGPSAPAINTGAVAGMPFRAFVRHGRQGEVLDLKLKDIGPTQVLVRTRASSACYTITTAVLGDMDVQRPNIPNHSGMGVVEAVGAQVRRVRPGDRVLVSGTPYCGHCKQCLVGTPERCNYLVPGLLPAIALAETADGAEVFEAGNIGGLSEMMVAYEEYCVPIFSDLPDEQIAMLGDVGAVGIAATSIYDPIEIGQNVVIFGAGPIGLSAVQAAHHQMAGRIIVIEPIAYRRQKALDFGATAVLDPNEDTDGLIERVLDMCADPTDRLDAGGSAAHSPYVNARGGDLVIDCSGLDRFPPIEPGPDPTGLLALRQAWEVTVAGGSLVTLAVQEGDISFPAAKYCLSSKRHYSAQMGGMNVMRDTPRYITAIERGYIDMGALVTATYPLEGVKEGFAKVAERSEIGVVLKPG